MIKPKRLKRGDRVAVVSLSWGGMGDANLIHKYEIAKERLEKEFGLEVVCMPNALAGSEFIDKHPEARAKDLTDAFEDSTVAAIICAIGGDDTIRLLPYMNLDVIRKNPKIFMGYSDSTINHFMLYKAGVVSFYGPTIMSEFGEYVKMFDYTKSAVKNVLFDAAENYPILPSNEWTDEFIPWDESNKDRFYTMKKDVHGYEVINGSGVARGHLLGGCIDVFTMANGTEIWPTLDEWRGAVLFIETSEDRPTPDFVKWTLRNFAAQGILRVLSGIIVGKPQGEQYYEEYKAAILKVVADEEKLCDLPVIYNMNFGHAKPIGIIPYGIEAEINCKEKTVTLLESAVI